MHTHTHAHIQDGRQEAGRRARERARQSLEALSRESIAEGPRSPPLAAILPKITVAPPRRLRRPPPAAKLRTVSDSQTVWDEAPAARRHPVRERGVSGQRRSHLPMRGVRACGVLRQPCEGPMLSHPTHTANRKILLGQLQPRTACSHLVQRSDSSSHALRILCAFAGKLVLGSHARRGLKAAHN